MERTCESMRKNEFRDEVVADSDGPKLTRNGWSNQRHKKGEYEHRKVQIISGFLLF